MHAPTRVPIEVLLQKARHLRRDGDERRELVERQDRPPPRFGPEAREQRRPLGVHDAIEPRNEAGDFRRKARQLQGALAVVGDVVGRASRREHFAQEPRLAAPPPAVEDAERAVAARHEPPQP